MVYLALMTSSSLANLLHSSSASDTIFATLNEHVMNMILDAGVSILESEFNYYLSTVLFSLKPPLEEFHKEAKQIRRVTAFV